MPHLPTFNFRNHKFGGGGCRDRGFQVPGTRSWVSGPGFQSRGPGPGTPCPMSQALGPGVPGHEYNIFPQSPELNCRNFNFGAGRRSEIPHSGNQKWDCICCGCRCRCWCCCYCSVDCFLCCCCVRFWWCLPNSAHEAKHTVREIAGSRHHIAIYYGT